jgi:uncharacterized protein (DUF983 family)
LGAILLRLCPRCGQGPIFGGTLRMNETCSTCGLLFGRGQAGYFTGAMYVSYALSIVLIAGLTLIAYLFLPSWTLWQLSLLAGATCVPLIPWIWQYSRVLWIHFDQAIDPDV